MAGIDIERQGQIAVAFKASALIVAFESLLQVAFRIFGSTAFGLLLDTLAFASDEDLVLAGFLLFAGHGRVAESHAWVPAGIEVLSARLCARLFARSGNMALFPAFMGTTAQAFPTDIGASDFGQPARLVLERVPTTQARFGR